MKVFKFGGASVKDAASVKNVAEIVAKYNDDQLLIIVSAMGKTTNNLETVINTYLSNGNWHSDLKVVEKIHHDIIVELFNDKHELLTIKKNTFENISNYLTNSMFETNLELYSEIVSQGELISTKILYHYLNDHVRQTKWLDSRKLIKTDDNYIDARLDWDQTKTLINKNASPLLQSNIVVSQGFIGSNNKGLTTTLGREGSDFSAAIFATCLNAESMTVWKDVPGILNGDPKLMADAKIIDEISYQEASELTYYGAKVIHPRTIKPLAQSNIKLYVRSFTDHSIKGTLIGAVQNDIPTSFIQKEKQVLIDFNVKDYSFIDEKKLSIIFHELDALNIKINLMQNSAISFSICIDKKFDKVDKLIESLKDKFDLNYFEGLKMLTIKNFNKESLQKLTSIENILMQQRTAKDIHVLYTPK